VSAVSVRHTTPDDAPRLAAICNALSTKLHGSADVSEENVRHWFSYPDITFWGAELDGTLVGHLDVRHEREANRFEADVRVDPAAWGNGVADALLDVAEGWAREEGADGPVLLAYSDEAETELRGAVERRGYEPVRHFFRMEIELGDQAFEPEWPAGIEPRPFDRERDDRRIFEAHHESFADHWGFSPFPIEEWRTFTLESPKADPTLWKLGYEGTELAGFSINSWHESGDPRFGWVGILGVRSPWRRRGLGRALLLSSFEEFRRRGAARVGLGVDTENATGAVHMYEEAGMRAVRRNHTYELKLAPRAPSA
jgi:mycothiol synthase